MSDGSDLSGSRAWVLRRDRSGKIGAAVVRWGGHEECGLWDVGWDGVVEWRAADRSGKMGAAIVRWGGWGRGLGEERGDLGAGVKKTLKP